MRKYVILADDEQNSRRSIADAVEVLRETVAFRDSDRAKIRVGLLRLPSDEIVGLVQLEFAPIPERVCVVRLPPSSKIRAKGASQRQCEFADLNGATVDGAGNVRLARGTLLRAVQIIPTHLPLELSDIEWRIAHHTISIADVQERCYRHVRDDLPAELRLHPPAPV